MLFKVEHALLNKSLYLSKEYSRINISRTKAVKMLSIMITAKRWKERKYILVHLESTAS